MNALAQLDAACVAFMVSDAPITFSFGGKDWTGTTGARDTMRSLTEGGYHSDEEFSILVEAAQYGSEAQPGEDDTIEVCVDANGIPCAADDAAGSRVACRVKKIGRAGGGLTYTVITATRG